MKNLVLRALPPILACMLGIGLTSCSEKSTPIPTKHSEFETLESKVEPDHDDAYLATHHMLRIDRETIAERIRVVLDFELPKDTQNIRGSKPDPVTGDPDYDGPDEFIVFTIPETHRQGFLKAVQTQSGNQEPMGRSVVAGKKYGLPFSVGRGEYWILIEEGKSWARKYRIWYDETNGSCYLMWFEGKSWEI